jgi:sporulation protein YlmC with PRC-barrel domain
VGDVILVHDESAVERRWSSYGLSTVVGCDVVTERGTYIGRVRDFEFNPDDGMVQRIVVDALGLPIVPEGVVSTYAVDVTEILSTGMDRIILAEGAESRVEQLSASLLQRLQLTAPPWEDDLAAYADYYEADVRAAQQAEWERQQAWARQSQMDAQRMRRDDYYAAPPPQTQQTQRERYYQDSRSMEGIPLVRPNQPFERRDADGGYGERPPPQRQRQQQSMEQPGGGRAIGDWMVREERRREMEMEYEYADGGYEPMREMNGRGDTNRRVESPPPPPADAWAKAAPPRNGSDDSNSTSSKSDGWDSASSGSVSGGARKGFDADEDML